MNDTTWNNALRNACSNSYPLVVIRSDIIHTVAIVTTDIYKRNSELRNTSNILPLNTDIYNIIKLMPERNWNNMPRYSTRGEWKCARESLWGAKPPVAVVVIE